MNDWNLRTVDAEPHHPLILSTTDDARAILLHVPAGERMQEHEVHERAWVLVIEGEIDMSTPADGASRSAGPGHLFEFDPHERHEVSARADTRLLLLLTPWPGAGHPGAMTLEEKAEARTHAGEHTER